MANKKVFKPVRSDQNVVEMEEMYLKWWEEKDILKKYLGKNSKSQKRFSFIDGPITANNPMGLHHAWGRTMKDVVQRYKNMQGYEQRFQNGFDCQGLWVEVEVEKALGFNSKKDITDYGLGKFTDACKARVNEYSGIQTEQSKRLGQFMDWENSYYTMSEENNLYIWKFLSTCYQKGLLYKSKASTTWCPRCETGLSQHEQLDGYEEIVDDSVYVKFRLKDRENEYMLAWTTTPWTLSANVLLAVNPEFQYVKASSEGETLYLVEEAAKRLGLSQYEKIEVADLVGLQYESLYDIPAQEEVVHKVVGWDLVDRVSGSGVVHVAPGCGEEDFQLGKELDAPALAPLDTKGVFIDGYGDLTGKYAHDVNELVFEYLKDRGFFFKKESFKHKYPHCWRCKTKCLFRLETNWFLNIEKIKPDLKEQAKKANWMPDYVGLRMQDWLNNMGDWMISRNRYYGLALPFYEDEDGDLLVVDSKEMLRELAVEPEKVDSLPSLHRPWIDEIKIKSPKTGNVLTRISDVGDCWLDAGVVPFSTLKYLEDKEYWQKWFPADFVTEMVEQVRLWYYSMLVFGVIFENQVPYANVLSYAEVRDEKNQRMSKTKKNGIPYDEAVNKIGADLMRWNYLTQNVRKNVLFGWSALEDVRRKFYLPLWNSYTYFVTYANMHGWLPDSQPAQSTETMDRWALSALGTLVKGVEESMDAYEISTATRLIEEFVKDLSTWYIRGCRDRFKNGDKDSLRTLHTVLLTLSKLLAPCMPFLAEDIYQNLAVECGLADAKESVHLEDYPVAHDIDQGLLSEMAEIRSFVTLGLKVREENRLKLRQPLEKAYVNMKSADLAEVLANELNVRVVECMKTAPKGDNYATGYEGELFVTLETSLSDELMQEGFVNEFARKVQVERKDLGLNISDRVLLKVSSEDDFVVKTLEANMKDLLDRVGGSELQFVEASQEGELDVNGHMLTLSVAKA